MAEFFREFGVYVIRTGRLTGLTYMQVPIGDEWFYLEVARVHPLVRAVAQDTAGESGFGVSPTEMFQLGEPTGNVHDLWFLENVGQTITENSHGTTLTGISGADIDAKSAWGITQGSSDIIVAVFDSGVDFEHPEFAGRIHSSGGYALTCPSGVGGSGNCCTGSPIVCTFGDATDNHGHGTSVASVLGATADNGTPTVLNEEQYVGVDPSCTIFPVRISYDNIPINGAVLQALEDIYFLDDDPPFDVTPQIVNMSFNFGTENTNDPVKVALRTALDNLQYNGVIVVTIAGNGGDGSADQLIPGIWNNTITVAATDMRDDRLHSAGPVWHSGSGECVDFAAPGFGMAAAICPESHGCDPAWDDHGFYSGTSAAAPVVSGIVSLMMAYADSLSVTLTWDNVYDLLHYGADPTLLLPHTEEFGWGRVDAFKTLDVMGP